MITKDILINTLNKYGIRFEKMVKFDESNLLDGNTFNRMVGILDYLINEVDIIPSNIEKCPSILSANLTDVKNNYNFLSSEDVYMYNVENCLHVLELPSLELKNVYYHILDNYGIDILNKNTSVLSGDMEKLRKIERDYKGILSKEQMLWACNNNFTYEEVNNIISTCNNLSISIFASVFKYLLFCLR